MKPYKALTLAVVLTYPAAVSMLSGCGSASLDDRETIGSVSEAVTTGDGSNSMSVENWKQVTRANPPPTAGCFAKSYPSNVWTQVPCYTSTPRPSLPDSMSASPLSAQGSPSGGTVGNGNDFMATVTGTTIQAAVGTFPVVHTTGEHDDASGDANRYDIQLNTNLFTPSSCVGSQCQAWHQFEYSSVWIGGVIMEYWYLHYGNGNPNDPNNKCPNGFAQYDESPGVFTCQHLSDNVKVPVQPVTNLGSLELYALPNYINNGLDWVGLYVGSTQTWYTTSDSASTLLTYQYWNQAEFNIFGDWTLRLADFDPGTSIDVQEFVWRADGLLRAPGCIASGTTGETTNLSLPPLSSCTKVAGNPGYIKFTEANSPCTNPIAVTSPGSFLLSTTGSSCFAVPKSLVQPYFGWACSNCNGVTATVDQTAVKIGTTPLPAVWGDGNYYFQFSKAPYAWSQWNFWN